MRAAVADGVGTATLRERETLLAHEVTGEDTHALASRTGSSAGAVAAQLNRTRARLRVEYLLAVEKAEPPGARCAVRFCSHCRAVTVDGNAPSTPDATSWSARCAGDLCPAYGTRAPARGRGAGPDPTDADVVAARRAARELAGRLTFTRTDLTVLATAVSEVARNIVKFADTGEVVVEIVERQSPGSASGGPRQR